MTMDLVALQLALSFVVALSGLAMTVTWRLNLPEKGPGCWALAGLLGGGLLPLYSALGDFGMFLNMAFSLSGLLFGLEGILRFRGIPGERSRRVAIPLILFSFVVFTYLTRGHAASRCLGSDAAYVVMFLAIAFFMLRGTRGLERAVHLITALPSLIMALVVGYRWYLAFSGAMGAETHPYAKIVFLAAIPWTLCWTYGLTLAAMYRARQRISELASRDPLTGLANRRHFDGILDSLLKKGPEGTPFALFLLDVNGFKTINDQYGHAFGDAVLRLVGTLLDGIVSEGDLAVRFGGDEFVLLRLRPGGEVKTAAFETALRHLLNEERSLLGRRIRIGASIGRSLFPEDGTTADDLLRAADEAMYSQKKREPLVTEILGESLRPHGRLPGEDGGGETISDLEPQGGMKSF